MLISSMFKREKPVFSFEVFPPRRDAAVDTIYNTLDQLQGLQPDFISVTYGAGGKAADEATFEIARAIKSEYNIESLMHLTCLYSSRDDILCLLPKLADAGIENVMALRGDANSEMQVMGDFRYASELAAFIRENSGLGISGACYPEGHIECDDLVRDVLNLRTKIDAGCGHLVSQLFFDNDKFYDFWQRTKIAGIDVPIEAGIMPVTNKKQIERMVTLCGASLPAKFTKVMQRYEHHPQALLDAGIAYAVNQIVDLVAQGVDGIHLYTMNNPQVAVRIYENVSSIFQIDKG